MKVLVTGGAGYIGSFTLRALAENGFEPIVFDNLITGHREAIGSIPLYVGDLKTDIELLDKVFKEEKPQAVVHFAAHIEVGESVIEPQKYFYNNVFGTMNLLRAMVGNGVSKLVFSSTAAVYGEPEQIPIVEDAVKKPTNPYGESKLMVEKILSWYAGAYGLSSVALRYFNAAGAALDGTLGQDYPRPTHLITRACEAALGKTKDFTVFGNDYPTPDGTALRDYIHVLDLASAHVAALNYLATQEKSFSYFNVGTGKGYSVAEVVKTVKEVSGVDFASPVGPRRAGDPAQLIACVDKIKAGFGWEAKYSDLKTIIESAWVWHQSHPHGYRS